MSQLKFYYLTALTIFLLLSKNKTYVLKCIKFKSSYKKSY